MSSPSFRPSSLAHPNRRHIAVIKRGENGSVSRNHHHRRRSHRRPHSTPPPPPPTDTADGSCADTIEGIVGRVIFVLVNVFLQVLRLVLVARTTAPIQLRQLNSMATYMKTLIKTANNQGIQ